MGRALELTDRTFNRLKVIEKAKTRQGSNWQWRCKCRCGKEVTVSGSNLITGNTTSCGCARIKHGHSKRANGSKSPEYSVWHKLICLCHCPTDAQFHNYGAKGITVCDRWRGEHGFENFLMDMKMKPPFHALARKDKNRGFDPENCFWRTKAFRPFESLYRRAKQENENRKSRVCKRKFSLTYEEFLEFTHINACHYCGWNIPWIDHNRAPYNLDRKDNQQGYSKDNCVVCCFECNATKGARFSYKEMFILGKAIRRIKFNRLKSIESEGSRAA